MYVVQPQQQQEPTNLYGNNVSDIEYYQDSFRRLTALREEEKEHHETELERAQTAYDNIYDILETTKNKLRAMRNA